MPAQSLRRRRTRRSLSARVAASDIRWICTSSWHSPVSPYSLQSAARSFPAISRRSAGTTPNGHRRPRPPLARGGGTADSSQSRSRIAARISTRGALIPGYPRVGGRCRAVRFPTPQATASSTSGSAKRNIWAAYDPGGRGRVCKPGVSHSAFLSSGRNAMRHQR
jgi:hypothetical protein